MLHLVGARVIELVREQDAADVGGLLGKGEEGGASARRSVFDGHAAPEGEGATGSATIKEARPATRRGSIIESKESMRCNDS